MKKILLLVFAISSLSLSSCSSDDDNSDGNEYPKTVNIKFEITTTRQTQGVSYRTLNNDTQLENLFSLPFSFTYAQQEVNAGTYLKLTYQDIIQDIPNWTDYEAELKIKVGNVVVKTQAFTINQGSGQVEIDYTFN